METNKNAKLDDAESVSSINYSIRNGSGVKNDDLK